MRSYLRLRSIARCGTITFAVAAVAIAEKRGDNLKEVRVLLAIASFSFGVLGITIGIKKFDIRRNYCTGGTLLFVLFFVKPLGVPILA